MTLEISFIKTALNCIFIANVFDNYVLYYIKKNIKTKSVFKLFPSHILIEQNHLLYTNSFQQCLASLQHHLCKVVQGFSALQCHVPRQDIQCQQLDQYADKS